MDIQLTVGLRGMLTNGQAGQAMRNAAHGIVQELVTTGEAAVKRELYPGHGVLSGHYKSSIHGEMRTSKFGRITDNGVLYGPFLEGLPQRHIKRRTPGYAMFRMARQQLLMIRDRVAARYIREALGKIG